MSPVMRMGMRDSSAGRMERYDMENQDEPTTRSVMMRDAEDVPGELSEDEENVDAVPSTATGHKCLRLLWGLRGNGVEVSNDLSSTLITTKPSPTSQTTTVSTTSPQNLRFLGENLYEVSNDLSTTLPPLTATNPLSELPSPNILHMTYTSHHLFDASTPRYIIALITLLIMLSVTAVFIALVKFGIVIYHYLSPSSFSTPQIPSSGVLTYQQFSLKPTASERTRLLLPRPPHHSRALPNSQTFTRYEGYESETDGEGGLGGSYIGTTLRGGYAGMKRQKSSGEMEVGRRVGLESGTDLAGIWRGVMSGYGGCDANSARGDGEGSRSKDERPPTTRYRSEICHVKNEEATRK